MSTPQTINDAKNVAVILTLDGVEIHHEHSDDFFDLVDETAYQQQSTMYQQADIQNGVLAFNFKDANGDYRTSFFSKAAFAPFFQKSKWARLYLKDIHAFLIGKGDTSVASFNALAAQVPTIHLTGDKTYADWIAYKKTKPEYAFLFAAPVTTGSPAGPNGPSADEVEPDFGAPLAPTIPSKTLQPEVEPDFGAPLAPTIPSKTV